MKDIVEKQFKDYIIVFKGNVVEITGRKDGNPMDYKDLLFHALRCEQQLGQERTLEEEYELLKECIKKDLK